MMAFSCLVLLRRRRMIDSDNVCSDDDPDDVGYVGW